MNRPSFVLVSSFVAIVALYFSGTASATLLPADAGDPAIQDLQYDSATGEVLLDIDGATGAVGWVIKNDTNSFLALNFTPILTGVFTALPGELSEGAFSTPPGPWPKSIGFVFPTGMDLAAFSALITVNTVSTELGSPLVPFDLVVLSTTGVPEPATLAMSAMGLLGMALLAWRRRQA